MSESTQHQDGKAKEYAEMIKPGDAVETPDGALWVVTTISGAWYGLTSAYRGASDGVLYVEAGDAATHTAVPAAHLSKIADARQVRRG